jgi:diguanylate cyclase (GGDEF)-like protein/PAS domain S-box-containing protein
VNVLFIYCLSFQLGSSQFRSLLLNTGVVADYQSEKYSLMTLPSDPPSQRFRGMPLWAFVLLMLLALGAWSTWNVYIDYHNVLEQEYRLLEVRARQREARISGALQSANLMLRNIIDDRHDHTSMTLAERNQLMRDALRQLPELHNMLITDAKGRVLSSNNEKLVGFDASAREYFKVHRDAPGDDDFHVSRPFKTFTGITASTLSRVVRDSHGFFAGVIVTALDPAFFDEALKLSVYEPGVQSVLIHRHGDILNAVPPTDIIGKNLQGGIAYTEHMDSGKTTTHHLNRAKLAPVIRMAVFHNLPGAPLTVIVSRDYDSLMAEWRMSVYAHLASYILLALVTLLLVALLARRQKSLARTQLQLVERELELHTIIETEPECVIQMAIDGSLLQMNRAGLNMFEADSLAQVLGQKLQALVTPECREAFMALTQKVFAGESGNLAFEILGLKGGHRWLETHSVPLRNSQAQIIALLGVTLDISQRKRFEAMQAETKQQLESQLAEISELHIRLQDQVIRDPLTGLHNRRYLAETLPRELSRAKREGYSLALIMLDLDHFKHVNDTYGHAAGDEVLKTLSAILRKGARESDIICRYGGEEFLVALPRMSADQGLQRVETWRLELANTPIRYSDSMITVTLSAGIAGFPDHGADVETLLLHSDEALYRSKNEGRNRVSCFETKE